MLTPSLLKVMFHSSPLKGRKGISIYFAAGLISTIHRFFSPLLGSAVLAQVVHRNKNLETKEAAKPIPTGEFKLS